MGNSATGASVVAHACEDVSDSAPASVTVVA